LLRGVERKDIRRKLAETRYPKEQISNPVTGKAIGIIGLSDTVNEARIRRIVPENARLEKVELKPENEGAILVFQKESVPKVHI
jgi:hypothetical protein